MFDFLTEKILPLSALILSVVNGLFLFYNYLRDKSNLVVTLTHPEIYQIWLRLKDYESDGKVFRRYVFISYINVTNKGLRPVAVSQFRLHIKNRLGIWNRWNKKIELYPCNIPEPQCYLGDHLKAIPVFGQTTQTFQKTSNMIASGDCSSGMACWMYSVWGGEGWDPEVYKKDRIRGKIKIMSAFGKISECDAVFENSTIEKLKSTIPTLGEYFESS